MWKISELYQAAVWVYINGSVFGVRERVLLGVVYINPRSSSRTDAEISLMFSHMQHDVSETQSESQHMILVGDFNARLDNLPDHFPEGHAAMLFRFPELGTTRLGQYKDRANTAGRCLRDIALETPLLTTDRGKGDNGDNGQPTFFGYNPPFNPSRTEHILMFTALFFCAANKSAYYMNLTQQTTGHFFTNFQASVRYHTLICGFQPRFREEGKENIWFGGVSKQTRLFHTCLKMRLSYNLFGTLYTIKNINPATNTS